MANPTFRSSVAPPRSRRRGRAKVLPVVVRRLVAWTAEVSLVVTSAWIPYAIGDRVNQRYTGELVPLNPVLSVTQDSLGKALGKPRYEYTQVVAPLTNLLWSGAIALPFALISLQLYSLAKTGQTAPKRWLGIRIVDAIGSPPGMARVLIREGVGRWGLPLSVAYWIWRYGGAFPSLPLLGGLAIGFLAAEALSAYSNRQHRAFHDLLAGTFILGRQPRPTAPPPAPITPIPEEGVSYEILSPDWGQDPWQPDYTGAAVTSIVWVPEGESPQKGLWPWMRRHPALALLFVSLVGLASVLGTYVGTQLYIQTQTNRREYQEQDNQVFLTLVQQLSPTSDAGVNERREAILALGSLNAQGDLQEPRAIPLLVDLLSQEEEPILIEAIHQALVTSGPPALPYLRRLNQALRTDLDSMRFPDADAEKLKKLKLQATQRAISKLVTLYSGQIYGVDLNQVDLNRTQSGETQFSLVLDKVDLGGVQLRGALLAHASLKGTQFYDVGADERSGTSDDWLADLSGADLKEVNLTQAGLQRATLKRANLMRANLQQADLRDADVTGANLSGAALTQANLQRAILLEAKLTGSDLVGADLSGASLRSAQMGQSAGMGTVLSQADLSQSDWQGADLSGADLSRANLQFGNFSSVRLAGANLAKADLRGARLYNADLSLADLRGANLDGADFYQATFALPQSPHIQRSSEQFIETPTDTTVSALIQGVDFSRVRNLDRTQLSYICLHGGTHPQCQQ